MTGIEPANAGTTTQCLNHLATVAYLHISTYNNTITIGIFVRLISG